ncbi:hypothetical protein [Salinicoccus roseus]|uniref:hypothetical protein n=1 Tax=Salinicoccus roseus TaxID=45670 RepID=UPI0022FFCDDF|nr:hypothetical protein [Salinicoccus roseus]
MRMFFCGVIVALIIGLAWTVLMPDGYRELGSQATVAAFVCGALSQGIKQFKE